MRFGLSFLGCFILLRSSYGKQESGILDSVSPSGELRWHESDDGLEYARLKVPLNYNKPHGEEAIIPLVKIPAQHNSSDGSYKGMLLTNPGGFGLSGVDFIRDAGDIVLAAVGTNWDIVGFDVRGVGSSVPLADCGNSTSTTTSLDISLRSVPRLSGEFHQARIDAGIELGERCQQKMGGEKDAGPHMSSAIIARDQLHIVEAYARTCEARRAPDEGKLLNYFSMSYGTFAGQTFATLFPDRVGLMLMDAVYGLMTPESDTTFVERAIADVDGAIATFFVYCHLAGPEKCKYATGSRPLDTFNRFKKSYAQLDSSQAGLGVPADILEQSLVAFKLLLFNCLYTPVTTFPVLDNALVALEEALAAGTLLDWIEAVNEPVSGGVGVEDIFNSVFPLAMSCPEMKNEWFGKPLSEFKPTMERISKMSIIGDLLPAIQLLGCAGWSIDSVEIFQGPYGGNTKTPILFSSNSYDPVTPKSNAFAASEQFKGSQTFVVDSPGHAFVGPMSACALAKIKDYFQNGQLPGDDDFCTAETGPWDVVINGTLEEHIEDAGLTDLIGLMES